MTKTFSHNALDAALDYVVQRADRLCLCQGAPDAVEQAITSPARGGRMLGMAALSPGDFVVGPGLRSGRRLQIGDCAQIAVRNRGVADHLALIDSVAGEVLIVLPLSAPHSVAAGAALTVKNFADEILDPV